MAVDKDEASKPARPIVLDTKPTSTSVGLTDEERQMLEHLWVHHIAEHRHNEGR